MQVQISSIDLFNLLKDKLGETEAKSLTEYIEVRVEKEIEKEKGHLATKADLSEAKSELIKWMFIFWIGQVAVTFGFILLFIKN
jgi:hypothetical protein